MLGPRSCLSRLFLLRIRKLRFMHLLSAPPVSYSPTIEKPSRDLLALSEEAIHCVQTKV